MVNNKKLFDSIMIDWETMGTGPQAAVIQLGASAFNWRTGETDRSRDYLRDIDLSSSLMLGGYTDASTVQWWRDRGGFQKTGQAKELKTVLVEFAQWLKAYPEAKMVWCKGLSFDLALLEGYYRRARLPCPFAYNAGQEVRTVLLLAESLGWEKPDRGEPAHEAREDCRNQVSTMMDALKWIRSLGREGGSTQIWDLATVGVSP